MFVECVEVLRKLIPAGAKCGGWRKMSRVAVEDLYAELYGTLAGDKRWLGQVFRY